MPTPNPTLTRFLNHYGLAELPYFDLTDEGRLVLADPELGPAVDFHTHLALAYVRPIQLDLQHEHPETEHYLSLRRPLDLNVYANVNFTPGDLKTMSGDLTLGSLTAGGMRRTHTVPNLAREMAELGIAHSVLLAIDYPTLSDNAGTYLEVTAGRPEFTVFGSVHPMARNVEQRLERQVARGIKGLKVHPAVQAIRPNHPRAMRLYQLCAERNLPVLWHCGPVGIEPRLGRYMSQLRHYGPAVAENPQTTFLLGHSGALQLDQALAIVREHKNAYLELASQSLDGIRRILAEAPRDRILFGTDWPFYHQAMGLAKVFIATEGDPGLRRDVLYNNAAALLGLDPAP